MQVHGEYAEEVKHSAFFTGCTAEEPDLQLLQAKFLAGLVCRGEGRQLHRLLRGRAALDIVGVELSSVLRHKLLHSGGRLVCDTGHITSVQKEWLTPQLFILWVLWMTQALTE